MSSPEHPADAEWLALIREAAHELRTPLTVISGYSDLLLRRLDRDHRASSDVREEIVDIYSASKDLAVLIDLMVDDARARSHDELVMELRPVEISVLVRDAIDRVVRKRGPVVSLNGPDPQGTVVTDPIKGALALASLINGVLSRSSTPLTVEVTESDHVEITVDGILRPEVSSDARPNSLGVAAGVQAIEQSNGTVKFGDAPMVRIRLPRAAER